MKTETTKAAGTALADKPNGDTPEQSSQALAPATPAAAPAVAGADAKVPIKMGLAPSSLDEAWRMANFMSKSELVPKGYQNKPNDILVAIQYGMELGFAPMQALQSIAVINGKPGIYGDGFMALIMSSPLYTDHDEYYEVAGQRVDGLTVEDLKKADTVAVCTFWRRGKGTPVTRRFSVGQANKAGLMGKQGPWSSYPDRMLAMRARGFAGRDAFPDLMRGVRTAEELVDMRDDEPIETTARPEPLQPRRASESRAATSQPPATSTATAATPPASSDEGQAPPAPSDSNDAIDEVIRGLKVTNTSFVRPKVGEPYHQITLKTTTGRELTLLTRDETVYKEAASFEGTDHLVVIGVRDDEAPTASKMRVLVRLGIYEGDEQASSGELFDRP
jgi:hypothetical protein